MSENNSIKKQDDNITAFHEFQINDNNNDYKSSE